jgi:predicted nucleotidyltransferase
MFAFSAHINSRTGMSPFKLQYGVEPQLPSTAALTTAPITRVETDTISFDRKRRRLRNLRKYRTLAAERYHQALSKLAQNRDEAAFVKDPIQAGDLVMREPINHLSKLHPKWDGPFVVLDSTDKDAFQLASSNGYIINHLVNKDRLRKLDVDERKKYADEFWEASNRLRKHDALAKQQQKINELEIETKKATLETLERQQQGQPAPLTRFADLTQQRKELEAERAQIVADVTPSEPSETPRRPLRLRRPSQKAQEALE